MPIQSKIACQFVFYHCYLTSVMSMIYWHIMCQWLMLVIWCHFKPAALYSHTPTLSRHYIHTNRICFTAFKLEIIAPMIMRKLHFNYNTIYLKLFWENPNFEVLVWEWNKLGTPLLWSSGLGFLISLSRNMVKGRYYNHIS